MTASMDTMVDIQESGLSHPTLTGVLMALQWLDLLLERAVWLQRSASMVRMPQPIG
jgi:hypothetical protein